jgi:hypothetical protein
MKTVAYSLVVWLARLLAVWFAVVHLFAAFFFRGNSGAASTSVQVTLCVAMLLLALAVPAALRISAVRLLCSFAVIALLAYCTERLYVLSTAYAEPYWSALISILVELAVVAVLGAHCRLAGLNSATSKMSQS